MQTPDNYHFVERGKTPPYHVGTEASSLVYRLTKIVHEITECLSQQGNNRFEEYLGTNLTVKMFSSIL